MAESNRFLFRFSLEIHAILGDINSDELYSETVREFMTSTAIHDVESLVAVGNCIAQYFLRKEEEIKNRGKNRGASDRSISEKLTALRKEKNAVLAVINTKIRKTKEILRLKDHLQGEVTLDFLKNEISSSSNPSNSNPSNSNYSTCKFNESFTERVAFTLYKLFEKLNACTLSEDLFSYSYRIEENVLRPLRDQGVDTTGLLAKLSKCIAERKNYISRYMDEFPSDEFPSDQVAPARLRDIDTQDFATRLMRD